MKLIEHGKLLGKINVVDILLVAIVAIVCLVAYRVVFQKDTTVAIGAKFVTTTCEARLDGMPVGSSKYVSVGAPVYDNETNVQIGTLKSVKVGDYTRVTVNHETNEFVEVKVPDKENVYLTIEVDVSSQGPDLVNANNYYVKIGKPVNIRNGSFAGSGYMIALEREGDSK